MASINPIAVDAKDFAAEPPPRPVKVLKASSSTAKFSGGPKRNANSARGGAKNVKRSTAIKAAKKPGTKAVPRANPARPDFAIG